ncbi:hypothetical protein RHOFW510R12_00730 [Rhodanobacter sp. FW510-R12]|uniref:hypothetical protein n=1 Tax=Rhodanobacter thiooxydans TaxID=416169 RepID=UPI000919D485|nr:hypothetical protein [Rhodanobacter thiooxydans]UJJ56766.1 hypothetical protein LRK53_18295 [Rhodanobacter thiooxydans]
MTAINDTNTHTLSGVLKEDAQFQAPSPDDANPTVRCRFRIGCRKSYRAGRDIRSRVTWFNVKFSTAEGGLAYFQEKLKKGARVLIVGEQLVDEEDGPAGRRYWQFIRAHTVNVLVEAPVEEAQAQAPEEPKAQAAPPPEPSRQRQAPPEPRAPAPRPQHASKPMQLRPSRPSRADGKDDQATRNRASCIPHDGFETHFEAVDW